MIFVTIFVKKCLIIHWSIVHVLSKLAFVDHGSTRVQSERDHWTAVVSRGPQFFLYILVIDDK